MARVPVLDQQVGIQAPQASTPRLAGPVPGAFGEGVDEAISGVGKSIENLGSIAAAHIQRQNYWRAQEQVYDLSNKFHVDTQNAMFDDHLKTIKGSDGQDYDVPTGVLNRNGSQAHGATVDFDQTMHGLKAQALSKVQNPYAQKMLDRLIDSEYNSSREQVIKHELTQLNNAAKQTFSASLANQSNQAEIAQDPKSLGTVIDTGIDTVNRMADRTGLDYESKMKQSNAWLSTTMEKAVLGKLKTTGKTDDAMALLDSVKDRIPQEIYDGVSDKVDKAGNILEKQAQRASKEEMVHSRFDLINQVANGKINFENSGDVTRQISQKDPELAEAITKVTTSTGSFSTDKPDDEAYEELVKNVFNSGNREDVSKFLVSALNSNANGNISRDRLAILVNAATSRAKNIPLQNDDGSPKSPVQNSIDAGLKAAVGWNGQNDKTDPGVYDDYLKGVHSGKGVQESYNEAVKNSMIRKYPELATVPAAPNAAMSASQGLKSFVPGKSDAKANYSISNGAVVPKAQSQTGKKEGGRLMKDGKGNKAIVYPDGTFEEQS